MPGIYLDNVRIPLNLQANDADEIMPDGLNGRLIVLTHTKLQIIRWWISIPHRSHTPSNPALCLP